jgi:sulfur-oxidizing protein SoxY
MSILTEFTVVRFNRQLFLLLLLAGFASFAGAAGSEPAAVDDRWAMLRAQLFADRDIAEGTGIVLIEAPGRAFDSARVPVTVRAPGALADGVYIRKLYLIVDNNPLPVAATFTFEPNEGWDTIDTELRINEYTDARVVAELSNGQLHMNNTFVKAAGGCSAPPSSYDRSDVTQLGSIKGGIDQILNPKVPVVARFRLIHPNASGMQFDQFTRSYIQPHYVHTIGAEFNGKTLFTVETNFSLSQDPVLGFNFQPEIDGDLTIYALDSKNKRFERSWPVSGTKVN